MYLDMLLNMVGCEQGSCQLWVAPALKILEDAGDSSPKIRFLIVRSCVSLVSQN